MRRGLLYFCTMPKIETTDYIAVGHAAKLADVSRLWMRTLAKDGKVRAVEIDGQWFIHRKDAEKYERHPTAGRPRG